MSNSELIESVINNDVENVKSLLQNKPDINAKDNHGCTPLHNTCEHGDVEIIKLLIEHGADVNAKNNEGLTPLEYYRRHKPSNQPENPEIIELLSKRLNSDE